MKQYLYLGLSLLVGVSLAVWALWGTKQNDEQGQVTSLITSQQVFDEGQWIHILEFEVPKEAIKVQAPEVYALYEAELEFYSFDYFDVTGDLKPEVLVYHERPHGPPAHEEYAVDVYGKDEAGQWKSLEPEGPFGIEDYMSRAGWVTAVRSPYGDYAIAVGYNVGFFDWTGTEFKQHGAWYGTYEAWLERKTDLHEERISPITFTEEVLGATKRIVSDHYRLSFEVPVEWIMEGKQIHPYIWSLPEGDGLGAPTFKAYSTTDRYYGSWGHGHPLESDVDGTQASFDALRAQADGYATKDATETKTSQYQKVGNLSVSGLPAVRVRYWGSVENSDGFWDDDIVWIKDGEMNWYVVSDNFHGEALDGAFEQALRTLVIWK